MLILHFSFIAMVDLTQSLECTDSTWTYLLWGNPLNLLATGSVTPLLTSFFCCFGCADLWLCRLYWLGKKAQHSAKSKPKSKERSFVFMDLFCLRFWKCSPSDMAQWKKWKWTYIKIWQLALKSCNYWWKVIHLYFLFIY